MYYNIRHIDCKDSLLKIRIAFILALSVAILVPRPASAFDYLEHLWFTDRACAGAQAMIGSRLAEAPELQTAYLALAVMCPVRWDRPYCEDGYKRATSEINELGPGSASYGVTLGDYAALADHVSRQGPIRNLPRARSHGLVEETMRWLTETPGGAGGIFGDVAEDACETGVSADWDGVERDVRETVAGWRAAGRIETIEEDRLGAIFRAPLAQGPHDGAMKYSFDNPHYLDLVLRNHHHFGQGAYQSWNGFHSAAVQMRGQRCEELVVIDADEAEDYADHVIGWEEFDWDNVPQGAIEDPFCRMLGDVLLRKIRRWATIAPREMFAPVGPFVASLTHDERSRAIVDEVLVNVLSLVMEGTGIHYLQDGLAGGHMRTIRSREALVAVRYDHDADNRDGVVAVTRTREGPLTFVAWGDGYLLGRAPQPVCDPKAQTDEANATCLLRQQRGLLAAATQASLLDWAQGGQVYRRDWTCRGPLSEFVCVALPLVAPSTSAQASTAPITRLHHGTLPVPPPDFSYESLSIGVGYQPFDEVPSLSLRFATFREIDIPAHWLTSWEARLDSRFGERQRQSLTADLGFGFHYRMWARVMLDLVPAAFVGIRDFDNSLDFFAGVGPRLGLTALPEGWTKIPIEFSIFIDHQIVLVSTDRGFFAEPFRQLPRVGFGLGLAYMH